MNHAVKFVLVSPRIASPSLLTPASFFHSTGVLERKRRTQCYYRFNYYGKQRRNKETKRTPHRNISDYAEYLFQNWRDEEHNTLDRPSWSREHCWVRRTKKNGFDSWGSHLENYKNKEKEGFDFCISDDDEVETIFRSAFGGARYSYWSFSSSENFQWRTSSSHAYGKSSSNWSYETDEETNTLSQPELASERQALGLSVTGPLKLDEVKSAYRVCALRWHPDRHDGSSKIEAEEKFKHCSAAYKTLCDRLAMG